MFELPTGVEKQMKPDIKAIKKRSNYCKTCCEPPATTISKVIDSDIPDMLAYIKQLEKQVAVMRGALKKINDYLDPMIDPGERTIYEDICIMCREPLDKINKL